MLLASGGRVTKKVHSKPTSEPRVFVETKGEVQVLNSCPARSFPEVVQPHAHDARPLGVVRIHEHLQVVAVVQGVGAEERTALKLVFEAFLAKWFHRHELLPFVVFA
eukprot:CAMPEP_0171595648 /NCGR_PEP_ID=MMETSP0990-20121206/1458_1 /TAXON_ID=483369 /ORGANISM="non described non described, Strain CCMP2098" /LENGTH=106 /DNA_ID=CAMNT_0012156665 /DNA_START=59 /DNA_END=379 /DNA_ORIENTATION=+